LAIKIFLNITNSKIDGFQAEYYTIQIKKRALMGIFDALILGAIEGVSEFLPISSTGHLIVASEFLGIRESDFLKMFEVAIQLGAIFAVMMIYKENLKKDISLWMKMAVAFVPTGVVGLLFYDEIKELFTSSVVAYMFIIGGVAFIIAELWFKKVGIKDRSLEDVTFMQAIGVGLFQVLAFIPGTSRSGATILGGMFLGLGRKGSTEFSFMLAIPTMGAATAYDIYKNYHLLDSSNTLLLLVGFISSFIFAFIAIKALLVYLSKFDYIPFGIYRIVFGLVLLFWFL
jgi:undecaprenyl-diphosphatase